MGRVADFGRTREALDRADGACGPCAPLTFDRFFEQEQERLLRTLSVITGSRREAEDLAQEAFTKVFERWETVSVMEEPAGYLHRTAMNLFRNQYRRAKVAIGRTVGLGPQQDVFKAVEDRDTAARALGALTARQRAALVLTEALGYSGEEAGELLGIKASTVWALTHQARAALPPDRGGDRCLATAPSSSARWPRSSSARSRSTSSTDRRHRKQRNRRIVHRGHGLGARRRRRRWHPRIARLGRPEGRLGHPRTDGRAPSWARWMSTDTDGSSQTMEHPARATATSTRSFSTTMRPRRARAAPSTVTGTARLSSVTELVVPQPVATCDDGSTPMTPDGQPLDEVLTEITFVHDPDTGMLTDSYGVVWRRPAAAPNGPAEEGGPVIEATEPLRGGLGGHSR